MIADSRSNCIMIFCRFSHSFLFHRAIVIPVGEERKTAEELVSFVYVHTHTHTHTHILHFGIRLWGAICVKKAEVGHMMICVITYHQCDSPYGYVDIHIIYVDLHMRM